MVDGSGRAMFGRVSRMRATTPHRRALHRCSRISTGDPGSLTTVAVERSSPSTPTVSEVTNVSCPSNATCCPVRAGGGGGGPLSRGPGIAESSPHAAASRRKKGAEKRTGEDRTVLRIGDASVDPPGRLRLGSAFGGAATAAGAAGALLGRALRGRGLGADALDEEAVVGRAVVFGRSREDDDPESVG